jgi:hypothetical protein
VRFSEKYGHNKSARDTILTDSISPELRNSLWSLLKMQVWDQVYYSQTYGGAFLTPEQNPEMTEFCRKLWFFHFKKPLDTLPTDWSKVLEGLRKVFFSCEWYEVYDFVEFVVQHFPYKNGEKFIKMCNSVLQAESSGYRFVGDSIAPMTDSAEIDEIDKALTEPVGPVRTHLKRALELLSDRHKPDYRNSIKESISAVEGLVGAKLGEKGTLGQLIKRLEDEIKLHPALGKAFSSLYGYTSDQGGIRHALMESATVTFEGAKFFLVVCSAFVNLVEARIPASS